MKGAKVKKSPAVLGLSRKSKDKIKTKKKSKLPLSTSLKNVLRKHLGDEETEPDKSILKTNVKIVDKNVKSEPKSPKNNKKDAGFKKRKVGKNKKGEKKTSPVESSKESKPVVIQKVDYIDSEKVAPAVEALFNHCKSKNKKALFKSEGTPILVQFETVAIPKHPKTTLRFVLPHSPHSSVSDVLLIIADEKKHHRKLRHDDEMYIINFTEKLKELGVTQVSKVMTLRQIRAEYYTHEMRRKLSDMYDVFLVDGKLGCKLSSLIGKKFYESRKTPIPVSLEKEDKIKLEIERALRKTQIVFKSTCCTNSVCKIGHTDMTPKEVAENLEAFSKAMDTCKYPGGWKNIKKVHIKTPTSVAFPVYYSFVTPNEIENAELKQTLPKHAVAVKGELSTIGRDVIVRPDGSIEVEGVDDIKSLMHQLYKHAGFKDHQDLDLSNAEYKELVKELNKNIPTKPKPEDPKEPNERDVADLIDNDDSDLSSDDDDNTIHGEIQRDDNSKADYEDDDDFDEDEDDDEKEDGVEQSYMKQWEETWMNQESDEEEEKEETKGKNKKKVKNVKNQTNNRKQQNQQQQGKNKPNNKRKQSAEPESQGGKKQKASATPKKQGGDKKKQLGDKKKQAGDRKKQGKKDTPLRQTGGVVQKSVQDPVVQKKKAKKGSKAPNFIPL